jgi:hypothetical protein
VQVAAGPDLTPAKLVQEGGQVLRRHLEQHTSLLRGGTTAPATLPAASTWYVVTNLPHPQVAPATESALAPADLAELVRLYGLRQWVEQGYRQVKGALGWRAALAA